MTEQEKILHPFPTLELFESAIREIGSEIFGKYRYAPDWSGASIMDAYAFWTAEVTRCAREIRHRGEANRQEVSVPSQLKKAGALTSALNRAKPINSLTKKLTYDDEGSSSFKTEVVEVYINEYFAFEFARNIHLVADQNREGMANFEDFLVSIGLEENDIFSDDFVKDVCFFLRSRSPSSTSTYMLYRGIYSTSYAWRARNSAS